MMRPSGEVCRSGVSSCCNMRFVSFSDFAQFTVLNSQAFFFEEALLEDRPLPKSERKETFKTFFAEMIREVVPPS